MEGLLRSLSQSGPEILLVVLPLLAVALLLSLRNAQRISQQRAQWRGLLEGTRGANLERLLMESLRENAQLQSRVEDAESRIRELERQMERAKRHLGVLRYDAFEDVGGMQSFALALFDDHGDGAVLNGLIGRTDCRVYCKPLVGGRSDRNLSQEERRAVEAALGRTAKDPTAG